MVPGESLAFNYAAHTFKGTGLPDRFWSVWNMGRSAPRFTVSARGQDGEWVHRTVGNTAGLKVVGETVRQVLEEAGLKTPSAAG